MVTWGQVQAIPSSLFFVDSGLAGAGVKLAESAIKAAGITLERGKAEAGLGGGGLGGDGEGKGGGEGGGGEEQRDAASENHDAVEYTTAV